MSKRASVIVLAAVAVLFAVAASVWPVPTTFSIEASTEVLRLSVSGEHRADWVLPKARVFSGRDRAGAEFTGTLRASPGASVVFERAGRGPLRITIEEGKGASKAADLTHDGAQSSAPVRDRVVVVVAPDALIDRNGFATALPIGGEVTVGSDIGAYADSARAMLLNGRIVLLAHSLLGQNKYEAGKTDLVLGDWVSPPNRTVATGILRVGDEPAMRAVLRLVAAELRVERYGAQGYSVFASLLERIKHDGSLQLAWGAALFILGWAARWWKKA